MENEDLYLMIRGMVAMVVDELCNIPHTIKVKIVNPEIPTELPEYATDGSSAVDLKSAVSYVINPGETKIFPTNISMEIPKGYELQIRSRSGLAANGLTILNSPGTIDSDYRGEIKIILHNTRNLLHVINVGDRIAQAALCKVEKMEFQKVDELSDTKRGSGGFVHTGK